MSIRVSQLVKSFGTQTAVNQVSFSLSPGEIVGFLGPNGAGKSTTLKMITGLLQPDAGEVWIGGENMASHALSCRQQLGYLAESNALYTDWYVKEYLEWSLQMQASIGFRQTPFTVAQMVERLGLGPEQHKKIGQLSKGYRQRVGLAAALVHNPSVLVLDEPTTGLDPNQLVDIRSLIREWASDKTVLFSSHLLPEVEAICQRVLILHQGILRADENLSTLSQQKGLAAVFAALTQGVPA
ncbi:MAG: ATP-binding cassette domain-containing protein [Sphingobacteriia bacterium]|nr:MAG: ATP-binding cassette domain-containing protein [Sphingobacteriia bacterium]